MVTKLKQIFFENNKEMNNFVIYNHSDFINKPQMPAMPKTDEVRDFCVSIHFVPRRA